MILPGTPQVALSFLIGSSVKATLLLALAAAAAYGLRKHSAAVRHQLSALGLVCSLLLPVVALLLPSWHSATLGSAVSLWSTAHAAPGNAAYPNLSSMIVDAATASSFSGQWLALILAVWALGAAFIAVKLLAGLTRLLWISAQATPITGGDWGQLVSHCSALGISRSVRLLQSRDASSMPSTWGVLRPRILLPASAAEWSAEGAGSCLLMNSPTSRGTTGRCKSAPSWRAAFIGSIRWCGSRRRACATKANALAMTPC